MVGVLERSIGDVPRGLILGVFDIIRRPVKGRACNVKAAVDKRQKRDVACKPVADPIAVFWNSQGVRKMSRREFIGTRFANDVRGRKMLHRPSYP